MITALKEKLSQNLGRKEKRKKRKKRTIRTVSLFDFCFLNLFWTVLMISCNFVLCSLELFY